jgi:hypothetical protein
MIYMQKICLPYLNKPVDLQLFFYDPVDFFKKLNLMETFLFQLLNKPSCSVDRALQGHHGSWGEIFAKGCPFML